MRPTKYMTETEGEGIGGADTIYFMPSEILS